MNTTDRTAILDLISRYSYGYDTQDWELFALIWTDDAVVTEGDGRSWGVAAFLTRSRSRRETLAAEGIQTRHYQTNALLDVAEDGRVSGRTLVSVAWQHADSHKPVLMHTGEYLDEFVQVDGAWRFARREVVIDHA